MEIVAGKIVDIDENGYATIKAYVPYITRALTRKYEIVQVALPDGRAITPAQNAKIHCLIKDIADYVQDSPKSVKELMKNMFMDSRYEGLIECKLSLQKCDETTAKEFISFLIDFMIENGVSSRKPLYLSAEDIGKYVYKCLMEKSCCVCGKKADLHHFDSVGMGRDRNEICHLGLKALPLCREHHQMIHTMQENEFCHKYHIEPIKITEEIARVYGLNTKIKNMSLHG